MYFSVNFQVQFDLVCDRDIYPTIGLSALNVGGPIGVYLFGILNDRAGRRIAYFTCLATMIVGSLITAASIDFWMWCFSRVIVGLTIPAVYQIPFIIGKFKSHLISWQEIFVKQISCIIFVIIIVCYIFSLGICWTGISLLCNIDDVHFLHTRNYDVGGCYILSSQLGRDELVHIGAIFVVFFLLIRYAGESEMASSSRQIQ